MSQIITSHYLLLLNPEDQKVAKHSDQDQNKHARTFLGLSAKNVNNKSLVNYWYVINSFLSSTKLKMSHHKWFTNMDYFTASNLDDIYETTWKKSGCISKFNLIKSVWVFFTPLVSFLVSLGFIYDCVTFFKTEFLHVSPGNGVTAETILTGS